MPLAPPEFEISVGIQGVSIRVAKDSDTRYEGRYSKDKGPWAPPRPRDQIAPGPNMDARAGARVKSALRAAA